MAGFNDAEFQERREAAAKAKKAALESFRAKTDPNDPAAIERARVRREIAAAREARAAERVAARLAREQELAEQRARDAALAEQAAREAAEREAREKREMADREVALEAERKAERDARYAARKKRKR